MQNRIRDPEQREALAYAAELVHNAGALIVTAGAGIGVDAGLPDFRGKDGFWRAYPALRQAGLGFQEIASAACFDDDPRRAWGFYGHRLAMYRQTEPHRGFALLANWARQKPQGCGVLTSNVDGLFLRAGFAPERLHECHGSIHYLQCTVPCSPAVWSADQLAVQVDVATCMWQGELPTCPHCGALARPNILMFNDSRWIAERADQQERRQEAWLAGLHQPVVVEIGAGTAQRTVRTFGERMARERKALLVRINPDSSQDEEADAVIAMPALRALAAIDALVRARSEPRPASAVRSPRRDGPAQPSPEPARRVGKKPAEQTLRRRLALLSLLPAAGQTGLSVQALTAKLNVDGCSWSRRTVERDLAEMANGERAWRAAGIEIESNPDPANPQVSLWSHASPAKPLLLRLPSSTDALLVGLLAQELHAFLPASTFEALSGYQDASSRVWNWPGSQDYARYQHKIRSLPDGPAMTPPAFEPLYLREINEALLRDEQIDLHYRAASRGAESTYRLHPIGLVKKGRFFWLVAAKEVQGSVLPAVRTFRLDRVGGVERRVHEPVAPGLPMLQQVLDSGALEFFPAGTIDLVLRFAPGDAGDQLMANYAESPLSANQRIVPLPAGGHALSATVQHTRELVWMLQAQAHLLQVVAPENLRQELQRFAARVAEQYAARAEQEGGAAGLVSAR